MKGERLWEETLLCSLCCFSHEGPEGSAVPQSLSHMASCVLVKGRLAYITHFCG